MWLSKGQGGKKSPGNGLVAVAIDKDKSSQIALKWTTENLLSKGHPVVLIHVIHTKSSYYSSASVSNLSDTDSATGSPSYQMEKYTKDLFLSFRVFCTRKDIPCLDITLEDADVAKALVEYINYASIDNLVLGAARGGFIRKFKHSDVPSGVQKGAPDFCTVYVISKGKISSVRNASRSPPHSSPLHRQLECLVKEKSSVAEALPKHNLSIKGERTSVEKPNKALEKEVNRSRRFNDKVFNELDVDCSDISFISSERTSVDQMFPPHYDLMDTSRTPPRLSYSSDQSISSIRSGTSKCNDFSSLHDFSFVSQDSARTSTSSQMSVTQEEVEAEMRRMKLELKQNYYSSACKDALNAKQKAMEMRKSEEGKKPEVAALGDDPSFMDTERANQNAAMMAQLEAEKRLRMGIKARNNEDEGLVTPNSVCRYRKYTIEEIETATDNFDESRKIGEGGYGPVFKCYLDHTRVAVKILRPDAAQGRSQFNQEVEVLSCIRHPNLVLLLGACPEYGCLVYEYMARGSLDDRLFCRGKTAPLSWQIRFRIAAEIATGLHFLHQTKPEPIVHRDLKPANILLDQNFVSKISDVGLARLVPPTVADSVTQGRLTSTAGTLNYIDPEYQQTGILGVKSDVYSLGVLLLQLITAKRPMGLSYRVEEAIDAGVDAFMEMLDPAVQDWPLEPTLTLAKLAVQCAEMRRKDRPDLGKVVLPQLSRLRDYADDSLMSMFDGKPSPMADPLSDDLLET